MQSRFDTCCCLSSGESHHIQVTVDRGFSVGKNLNGGKGEEEEAGEEDEEEGEEEEEEEQHCQDAWTHSKWN